MFTLAHLSDAHLAPMPVPNFARVAFKQFAGYVNWLRSRRFIHRTDVLARIVSDLRTQKPDHIAMTGDIANIALPFEFSRGAGWLTALGAPEGVSLVPGNHDIYVAGAAELALAQWGGFMKGDTGERTSPYIRRRGPIALIGLCSGVPTELFYGSGRLGADQLAKLAVALGQLKTEELFRVVMIHHPPVSESHLASACSTPASSSASSAHTARSCSFTATTICTCSTGSRRPTARACQRWVYPPHPRRRARAKPTPLTISIGSKEHRTPGAAT